MIDVRAALVLLGSGGCGAIAGALRLAAGGGWPEALLTAGAAAAAAIGILTMLVKADRSDKP